MGGTTYNAQANAITEAYYNLLIGSGQHNRVYKATRRNGTYVYYTYHLVN